MSSLHDFVKLAEPQVAAAPSGTTDSRVDLAKQIISAGLAGLGIGAAGRGVMAFRNLGRPAVEPPFVSPGPSAVSIPVPAHREELDDEMKMAEESPLARGLASILPSDKWYQDAARIPGTVMTAGAGLLGGWQLTDWLLDQRRKSQLQEELDQSRHEYDNALTDQFVAAKQASVELCTGVLLDQLFGSFAKQALPNMPGTADIAGVYLLAAGLMAGGAGYGTYKWTKGRSDAALLAKAQKERARQLWNRSPQPVFAVPSPTEVHSPPAIPAAAA